MPTSMESVLGAALVLGGILFVLYAIFHALACSDIADSKGYSGVSWFILGGLFGVFALLAIGFSETAEVCDERREKKRAERKAQMEAG